MRNSFYNLIIFTTSVCCVLCGKTDVILFAKGRGGYDVTLFFFLGFFPLLFSS